MREPSARRKSRTAPMRSPDASSSSRLTATAGCQLSWPLKSRRISQTCSSGAWRIVLRRTSTMGLQREPDLERSQSRAEDVARDIVDYLSFAIGRGVKFGAPFGEGLVAVGDGYQAQGRDIILDAHRAFEDRIGAGHFIIGERQQPLADAPAVLQPEIPDAADLVGRQVLLDAALGDEARPVRQAIEIAHDGPDGADGGGDDVRDIDLSHCRAR